MNNPSFVFDARMMLEHQMNSIVGKYKLEHTEIKPETLEQTAINAFNMAINAVISDCQQTLSTFSTEPVIHMRQ